MAEDRLAIVPAGTVPGAPGPHPNEPHEDAPLLAAAPAAPAPADGPRLPDSCKLLLKELAEEMLVMHSRQETAEQRAELAEKKLTRRTQAADAAAERARRQAEALQLQLEQAQQQLEQERQLRQEAEQRVAELERQLAAAAQPHGRRHRPQQQEQQEQQPNEDMRRLGRAMLAGDRAGAAAQHQQQQQRQQRAHAVDRPLPPEQPGEAPAAQAGAPAAAAAGGQSSIVVALHSSDDDETCRTAVPGAAGAAAAALAGTTQAADAKKAQEAPAAQPAAMRPPPQRLGTLRGAVNPAKQAAARKRPAEGSLAAAAAAAGRVQAARRGEVQPPAKQQRREGPAADTWRRESRGDSQQRPDSASPGESAMDAAEALGRRLRRGSSAAAAAAAGGGALSPTSREAGPDLLLSLADAGQEGWEGDEEEEEGARWRHGRRGARAVAGVVTLKPGETEQQWLNRSIVEYVGNLARERDFRPFEKPVSSTTPDYYRLVEKPMDLATIKIKAQRGQYTSPKEFKADLLLIVNNAKFYNESKKHPVHQAADRLYNYLHKPHSFFKKVEAEFNQAQMAAVLNKERAKQEAELEEEEQRLARSVEAGRNVAVYADEDDINKNGYYLLQALGPVRKLRADETDDTGVTCEKGEQVIDGHYYDYWPGTDGRWDRSGGRRPYYLQDDKRVLVPASSLLLVDFELRQRAETKVSPFDGSEHTIYDVSPDLHQQLKRAIKKFTGKPAA